MRKTRFEPLLGMPRGSSAASREAVRLFGLLRGLLLLAALACALAAAPIARGAEAAGQPTDPADAATAQSCQELQAQKDQIKHVSKLRLVWDLLRVKFAPGSVAKPVATILATPADHLVALPGASAPPEGRNLIFSLEPPERVQKSAGLAAAQARYRALEAELRAMRPELEQFVAARTVDQCVARVKASGFDFDRFRKAALELGTLEWVQQIQDGAQASRILGGQLRHLRLHWELFRTTDLTVLYNALRSTQVRNVVIVSHAISEGKLVDSSFNEYPNGFFSDLSPTLQSLSVFSCHSDKVAAQYQLETQLSGAPTFHARRELILARGVNLLGIEDVVPMASAGHFLRTVDGWLSRDHKAGPEQAQPLKPYCSLDVTGLGVATGGLGFALNGQFVGSVGPDSPGSQQLYFPCALASRPLNVLVLKNINLSVDSDLSEPAEGVQAHANLQGARFDLPGPTVYHRPDGGYASSKWVFAPTH
jgi:hypothetical protein